MRRLLLLGLGACGIQERWAELQEVPELVSIEPAIVRPGKPVVLVGAHLHRASGLALSTGTEQRTLDLQATDPSRHELTPPDDLPSGRWRVKLRSTGLRSPRGEATFELWRGDTEPPCKKRYALKVQTERLIRRVAVDRVYPDGEIEHLSFAGGELGSLDRTQTPGEEGTCAAIWLVTTDGRRVLLADDTKADLLLQTEALAAALELPIGPEPPAPDAVPDEVPADEAAPDELPSDEGSALPADGP